MFSNKSEQIWQQVEHYVDLTYKKLIGQVGNLIEKEMLSQHEDTGDGEEEGEEEVVGEEGEEFDDVDRGEEGEEEIDDQDQDELDINDVEDEYGDED